MPLKFQIKVKKYRHFSRYYDPETYEFTSKDPAKADGEESAYQYCGGEPVNKVDPLGLLVSHSYTNSKRSVTYVGCLAIITV